ncbi:ribonuclease HI [bacterium]|nr:ribonuclease HI [bacterium]
METQKITIFSDGSSLGNPGPGGWGAIIAFGKERVVELGGREPHTTNNRMELTAIRDALSFITNDPGDTDIHTDSAYTINGITKWHFGWEKSGWVTKEKTEVLNRDLWEEIIRFKKAREKKYKVIWNHVGGHVGVAGNERTDEIATSFARGESPNLFRGLFVDYPYRIYDTREDETKRTARRTSKTHSRAQAYSYVSMVSGKIVIHKTWAECEKRVKGTALAKFKKALSKEDEERIIASWQG